MPARNSAVSRSQEERNPVNKTKSRDIGLDLLRIISMIMVVCQHTVGWGGLVESALIPGTVNWYQGNAMNTLSLQAVNCFVLISGYFLCTSQFHLGKLVSTWIQAAFYSAGVYIILTLACREGTVFSLKELIKCGLVVTMDRYWFVTDYMLLYCLFPVLNFAIGSMNRKQHLLCCCVLLLIFSVVPNIVYVVDYSGINGGYSLTWFCVLYLIAAYFRLYVPKQINHQKWMFPAYVVLALTICAERFVAYYVTPFVFGRVALTSLFYSYNSIVSVPCALALFQAFRGLELKSEKSAACICLIAPLTFAVYLIHEQDHFRPILWQWLNPAAFARSPWMVPYCLLCAAGIFAVCCLIEWVRQQLFRVCGINRLVERSCDRIQRIVAEWIATDF